MPLKDNWNFGTNNTFVRYFQSISVPLSDVYSCFVVLQEKFTDMDFLLDKVKDYILEQINK